MKRRVQSCFKHLPVSISRSRLNAPPKIPDTEVGQTWSSYALGLGLFLTISLAFWLGEDNPAMFNSSSLFQLTQIRGLFLVS